MSAPAVPHALLRPSIAIPFVIVALIWGSTWLVIKGQLDAAPPSWSVTYRIGLAAAAMFALALIRRERLGLLPGGHVMALMLGITQFCGNFNFLYRSEVYLTSGIVAVLFGVLLVPNAVLARIFLGQLVTPRFLIGGGIALAGIALLLLHEARSAPPGLQVGWGIGFALAGILCASVANIMQATPTGRQSSMVVMLAWAMMWGALADLTVAWTIAGPPVLPAVAEYWAGVAYLAIIGSVVTFPLYFYLIRELGAGRAAYNGVVIPVVAMGLSTLFEDYRWTWLAAGGGALVLAGMVVAMRARNPVR